MKVLLAILISLTQVHLFADGETYVYRVTEKQYGKAMVKAVGDSVGKSGAVVNQNPYYGTYVLPQSNTDYFLLKITPDDGQDPKLDEAYGFDLYQVQYIDEEGFIRMKVDNSLIYVTTESWKKVPPTPKQPVEEEK